MNICYVCCLCWNQRCLLWAFCILQHTTYALICSLMLTASALWWMDIGIITSRLFGARFTLEPSAFFSQRFLIQEETETWYVLMNTMVRLFIFLTRSNANTQPKMRFEFLRTLHSWRIYLFLQRRINSGHVTSYYSPILNHLLTSPRTANIESLTTARHSMASRISRSFIVLHSPFSRPIKRKAQPH
jgi:hypothetical protein